VADSKRLILKILNGPNTGAEAALAKRTVVGSGEDDDIAIADPGLVPEHFVITLEGNAISVAVGEAAIWLKGEAKSQGTFSVAPFDLIKFGSTACAIGPEDGAWPALTPSDLLPVPAAPPPAPSLAEVVPEREAPPVLSPAARPSRSRGIAIVGGVLIVLALLAGAFYWLQHGTSPEQTAEIETSNAAQAIVTAQKLTGVSIRKDEQGSWLADGYVETNEQLRRLRQAFLDARLPIKLRVASLEQQVTAIRTIVATAGAQLTVDADPKTGKIVLKGFLPELSHLDTLQRVLARDVTDLRPIDAQIVTTDQAAAEARRQLAAAGLEASTRVEATGATVRIEGSLPEAGRKAVQRVVADLGTHWPGVVTVEDATTLASAAVVTPAIERITVIVAGPSGFIRDGAGRRFGVGDQLANGEVIEEIRADEVVTSKDGIKHRYTFGGR
jgi:type III secretion system YscD/HrpQ family protein